MVLRFTKEYERMLRALAREIARIQDPRVRSEVIATLYLAGVRADGFHEPQECQA